ncbi:hypothetical protein CMO96_01605 [Candidatus Woesebacteria bacterium]|nr:hypothetical protein [Candidatus Woesebacteria bacterium]
MKILTSVVFALLFLLTASTTVGAVVDPRTAANNIHGIHVIDENDLDDASKLVNSSGGEWGYVTIVIREDDQNLDKWQKTFDRMRELHLIPLVRLATKPEGNSWAKPTKESADDWVKFLSSLNWVVENRYVILFNEPNHAKEWGNELDPEGYARILYFFHQKLKEESDDFFILPAGFDAAAPNSSGTMEISLYLARMAKSVPGVFTLLDGWASHAYPNPGFSGSPQGIGKGTISGFSWEVSFLGRYGVSNNIPIFITETGWVHKEGKVDKVLGYDSEDVGNFFKQAYTSVWRDPRIVAVTPFVLSYQDVPFDQFSWKKYNSNEYHSQYQVVQAILKKNGQPQQIHDSQFIDTESLPEKLVTGSSYSFQIIVKNTGQSIWADEDGFSLGVDGDLAYDVEKIVKVRPFEDVRIMLNIKTPEEKGLRIVDLQMMHDGKPFGERIENQIDVVAPPSIIVRAKLWFKKKTEGDDFRILLYRDNKVEKEIVDVSIVDGESKTIELRDVIPDRAYRFVILKPFYLPRQEQGYLSENIITVLSFERMLPVDFNKDGSFSVGDILEGLRHPLQTFSLLAPI